MACLVLVLTFSSDTSNNIGAEEEAKGAIAVKEISDDDSELPGSPDGKRKRGQSRVRIRGTAEWTLKNPRGRSPQRGRRGRLVFALGLTSIPLTHSVAYNTALATH